MSTTTTTAPFKNEVTDEALASKLAAESKRQIDDLAKAARAPRKAAAKPTAKPSAKVEAPKPAEVKVDPKVEAARVKLREVAEKRAEFEKVVASQDALVKQLRAAKVTWKQIAEDLGMSAVWIQRKYSLGK